VPARNEETCLGNCLQSLVAQPGVQFEVIVVDDGSSDRTAEIAGSFRGVKVIDAGALPAGWTGKNNAMSAGARVAKGKWLLFTDADTFHQSGSLARAVAEAEEQGAVLLSYSPEQEVQGFWEKAVMPVIFAELAVTYPPAKVNDPASPIAAANGQYLLISRTAYDAVGGHKRVAGDLLEDVAMARLVKSSRGKIFFRYGGDAVRTRMYRSWAEVKQGWTKNLALLFRYPRALAVLRSTEFLLISGGLLGAVWELLSRDFRGALLLSVVGALVAAGLWLRIRRANFSVSPVAFAGLPAFAYLLWLSSSGHQTRGVVWKGRSYGGNTPPEPENPPRKWFRKTNHGLSHPQS